MTGVCSGGEESIDFLISKNNKRFAEIKIEEKAPKAIPTKIGTQKTRITCPPKTHNATKEIKVVPTVKTVLESVSLVEILIISDNEFDLYFLKFSRIRS